jgi:5-formyltetrahydrofolate cyclo-ligase
MKSELRKEILEKRKSMNSNEVQEKSKAIIDKLKNDNDYIKAKTSFPLET